MTDPIEPTGEERTLDAEEAQQLLNELESDIKEDAADSPPPMLGNPVMLEDFDRLHWLHTSPELQGLSTSRFGFGGTFDDEDSTLVATMNSDGRTEWAAGGLNVRGTRAMYKGVFLRGYTRADLDVAWPANHDTPAVEALGGYSTDESGYKALLPTWDYPRFHET